MALSKYGRVFNSSCFSWGNDRNYNEIFLKAQETYFNDILVHKGYVYLRDVYEALGFPVTRESCVVGWVYEENNAIGDNYISFSIENIDDKTNPDIEIDFNVDGCIIDRIFEKGL